MDMQAKAALNVEAPEDNLPVSGPNVLSSYCKLASVFLLMYI